MKELMKNSALMISEGFRPMSCGRGAKNNGPTSPPIGRKLPTHENCSAVGMKSRGESDRFPDIFAIAGLDHPMAVPHDTPMRFAVDGSLC